MLSDIVDKCAEAIEYLTAFAEDLVLEWNLIIAEIFRIIYL
jgi:hypothetical protein